MWCQFYTVQTSVIEKSTVIAADFIQYKFTFSQKVLFF